MIFRCLKVCVIAGAAGVDGMMPQAFAFVDAAIANREIIRTPSVVLHPPASSEYWCLVLSTNQLILCFLHILCHRVLFIDTSFQVSTIVFYPAYFVFRCSNTGCLEQDFHYLDSQPRSLRERPLGCKTVFVGGIPEKATEQHMKEIFERYV